jgi:hypothetical protein
MNMIRSLLTILFQRMGHTPAPLGRWGYHFSHKVLTNNKYYD